MMHVDEDMSVERMFKGRYVCGIWCVEGEGVCMGEVCVCRVVVCLGEMYRGGCIYGEMYGGLCIL